MIKKFSVLATLMLIVSVSLLSQLPLHRNFTIKDGLPSNTVYKAFQDPKGYMYFLTSKGVCRFDGAEFVKIQIDSVQSEDMPYGAMDSLGRLWVANLAGEIVLVDGVKAKVIRFSDFSHLTSIKDFSIEGDFLKILLTQGSNHGFVSALIYYNVNTLKEEKEKRYYNKECVIGYLGKVKGLTIENKILEVYIEELLPSQPKMPMIVMYKRKFTETGENRINLGGILQSDKALTYLPDGYNITYDINFEKDFAFKVSKIKLLSSDKIVLISEEDNIYILNIRNKKDYFQLLEKQETNTVFLDKLKRYWICTPNKGLFLVVNEFVQKKELYHNRKAYPINYVFNDNNFFVNYSEEGIFEVYDKKLGFLKKYFKSGIGNVSKILNHKKLLYVSSEKGSVFCLNSSLKSYTFLDFSAHNSTKDIFMFNQNLYLAINFGVIIFTKTKNPILIHNIRTYAINSRNDTLLLGTTKGLYGHYQDSTFPFRGFRQFELFITKLYVDSTKTIWICTDGKGLVAYKDEKNIRYFGKEEGMPSLNCSDVVQLDKERYAVGTDKGLWIFNIRTGKHFMFDELDGLESNEITALVNDGQYLWIRTKKGLVKAEVSALKANPEIPHIEIAKAESEHGGIFTALVSQQTYQQNHIVFHLSSRALLGGEKRNYQYRLLGLDTNWISTSEQKIEFLGLAPGTYTFQAKVMSEDGVECAEQAIYTFSIASPWWRTYWFYSLIAATLAGVIYYRFLQINKKQEEELKRQEEKFKTLQQINEYRQQALQSQMNPHFIFNSLNAIQSFLSTNDEKNAMLYLSKFGRLIRQIFDQSKQKMISLDEEIEMLQNYLELEKLRFKDKVKVNFEMDPDLESKEQDILVPPLLIQPIIENSFRHGLFHKGDGGVLDIRFLMKNNRLKCIVRDNGIGRERAKTINKWRQGHKSSGLSTTSDRIRILDEGRGEMYIDVKDLYDVNNEPSGTETTIQL